jgi:pullulanase/glycogen debranching enzyme
VAFTLHDKKGHSIFVAFNANYMPAHVELPEPDKGKKWYSIVNTSHEEQGNFVLKSALKTHITMKPYSSLVLQCH